MRIGLIDVDGHNYPNLPLMKLSAWHKAQGDDVEWYMPFHYRYDVVYMSKVFSFTPDFEDAINADKVIKGGTGYSISVENGKEVFHKAQDCPLSHEIEHSYPDYTLYPKLTENTAYGFLTRGCPRGCNFCIVGPKEGMRSVKVADLDEFWRGQKKIVLCDPNILASKEWKDLLQQLIDSKAEVDFNQGLDIRLMTEEKVSMLNRIKTREIHFAWDKYADRDAIVPKLKLYARMSGMSPNSHKSIVYTLVNYDSTLEQDLDRIYTLRNIGFWPYVMIYDKEHCERVYKDMQGWVNNRAIFARCEKFEDFKR